MRIAFVTAAFLPESIGGVELHVRAIARALRDEHAVAVFCRRADPARPEFDVTEDAVDGIPVTRLNYLFSDCRSFEGVLRNAQIRRRFESFLDAFRPDVVHVHHLTCLSTDLMDAARERGVPVVMTLHDFWMGCPRGQRMTPDLELCEQIEVRRCAQCLPRMWSGWFGAGRDGPGVAPEESARRDVAMLEDYQRWIRGVLLRADRLFTPSHSSRDVFAREGIPAERIAVVENGLDPAPFAAARNGRTARDGRARFRFGYIGSVLPTKGVHVLVDAFGRLADPHAELHVHGEAGAWHEVRDYGERLAALARDAEARGAGPVVFHGRYEADEAARVLAGIDALVVPSLWYEAFCLTLREGFLADVPVLASRIGAVAEGIEEGATGLLFRAGDAEDLSRAMRRIRDDAALRERLARAPKGVRTVRQNADELLAHYRDVIARSS